MRNIIYLFFSFLSISDLYSYDIPPIFISPNPNLENYELYSGNINLIKLDKKESFFSLSDILKNYSNLPINQSGGLGSINQIRIRGSEANHTLFLIDGIEINDPATGSEYDLTNMFSYNIDNIAIIKGAYSSIYGPDAIGGVININTVNKNSLNIALGDNNTYIKNYSISLENKFFQYGADINLLESSGIDTSGSSSDKNRYENQNIRLNLNSINHKITILYFDIFRQNDRNPYGYLEDNEVATTDINQIYSKYAYEKKISNDIYTKKEIQYITTKNLDFSPVDGLWETLTQSEKIKFFSNTSINLKKLLNSNFNPKLSFNIDYEKTNFTQLVKDKTYGDGDKMESEYSSSFSSEILYPINNFQFDLSLRRTLNQRFNNNNSHRFGVTYKNHFGKFFINHSTAFKNPTYTERFGYYTNFLGNANLAPENLRQYELGYSIYTANNNLLIKQTIYNSKFKNEIDGYVAAGNGIYTSENINSNSYRKGIETSITKNINNTSSISFSHDYIKSSQYNSQTLKQEAEIRVPKNLININYNNYISNLNIDLNFNILYSSKIKDKDFNVFPARIVYLKDYFLLNSTIKYNIKNSNDNITLFLKNILNRQYNETYGYNTADFELLVNYNKTF